MKHTHIIELHLNEEEARTIVCAFSLAARLVMDDIVNSITLIREFQSIDPDTLLSTNDKMQMVCEYFAKINEGQVR